MREKVRIQRILSLIETIRQKYPDIRFNQLVSNLLSPSKSPFRQKSLRFYRMAFLILSQTFEKLSSESIVHSVKK